MAQELTKLKRDFKSLITELLCGLVIGFFAIKFLFMWDNWFLNLIGYAWCLGQVFLIVTIVVSVVDYYRTKISILNTYK